MLKLTQKILLATFFMAFSSGSFCAFGSDDNNNNQEEKVFSKRTVFEVVIEGEKRKITGAEVENRDKPFLRLDGHTVSEILPYIFWNVYNLSKKDMGALYADSDTEKDKKDRSSPLALALVCKAFANWVSDYVSVKTNAENGNRIYPAGWKLMHGIVSAEDKETFRLFEGAKLIYRPNEDSDEGMVELPFSELLPHVLNGTFDLSKCGDASDYIRITTSVEELFKVKGDNKGKLVFLVSPFYLIKKHHADKFETIMENWDSTKAPVGLFWRWGNVANKKHFNYQVTRSAPDLSNATLFENMDLGWSTQTGRRMRMGAGILWSRFVVHVCL